MSRNLDSSSAPYYEYFKLYNYGSRYTEINLITKNGNGIVMFSATGQSDILNNVYTALPVSDQNSQGYMEV